MNLGHDLVRSLHAVRNRFGPDAAREKRRLLGLAAARVLNRPGIVLRYHETLLFLAAHPGERRLDTLVEAELHRVAEAASRLGRTRDGAKTFLNTGLPGTTIESRFSLDLLDWLSERHHGAVEIGWQSDATGESLDDMLGLLVLAVERDGLMSKGFTTPGWVRFAANLTGVSDLQWLVRSFRRLTSDGPLLDAIFDEVGPVVRWRIADEGSSRSFLRFPARAVFRQRGSSKHAFAIGRLLARPPAGRQVPLPGARRLIEVARTTLALRRRETDPVTYANPREVTLFRLERGIDVAVFGMTPARRLPIESFFGYVAARNRVPVAYGGAWIFGHRAEVGIHLFETFRGGESAYLFAQVLRAYRHHFAVDHFFVDPFQFGADNEEAIRSGAFWFYYRLGFRPVDPALRRQADEEWSRLRGRPDARTPAALLRRLARSPLVLQTGAKGRSIDDPSRLAQLGVAVTAAIGSRFGGDRLRSGRWASRRVARLLRPGPMSAWSQEERAAFTSLSPLVAVLPGVEAWPARDRRALVALMRAKGGPRERRFVMAVQRHDRLREAVGALLETRPLSTAPNGERAR